MTVSERLERFRSAMKKYGMDAYYVPTNDYHGSEYVDDYFKGREYLSGFTGSAGTLIVLPEEAGLWTDGRYFIQAEEQLRGTGITLYRKGEPGVPGESEFLQSRLTRGQCLGFDARVVDAAYAGKLRTLMQKEGVSIRCDIDLLGEVWAERPPLTVTPAYELDRKYAGAERREKLEELCGWMREKRADMLVLTSLDDIAWLLNLRGSDIHCCPVVMSYLVITAEKRLLFARRQAFDDELKQNLTRDGVALRDYESIYDYLSSAEEGMRIAMDLRVVNYALLESVPRGTRVLDTVNPTRLRKARKNSCEIEGERTAHVKDGIALVRFLCWLKQNIAVMPLTEMRAAEKLEEFRRAAGGYQGPSFDPIAAYGEHGAVVHYSATPETDAALEAEGFLLLDTGAHYLEGTTDVTRTVLLGKATPEQKRHYTAVLRGNLRLAAAKFKKGCTGVTLDGLAREPLWEIGCDFKHGTGHGVGHLLNVHEGPNVISYQMINRPDAGVPFEAGMITSNEPGIYLEGRYGIRLENLMLCVPGEKTEFGEFLEFETLTLAPFEREAIDPAQMTAEEKHWLNAYHERVYDTLSPYLSREEAKWLFDACEPID